MWTTGGPVLVSVKGQNTAFYSDKVTHISANTSKDQNYTTIYFVSGEKIEVQAPYNKILEQLASVGEKW